MTRGEGEGSYHDAGDTSALSQSLTTTRARREAPPIKETRPSRPAMPVVWESQGVEILGEGSLLSALADKFVASTKRGDAIVAGK